MSPDGKNKDLFNEIKHALDSIADPARLKTLSGIERDLVLDRLKALYDKLTDLEEPEVNQEEKRTVEFEVSAPADVSPVSVDEKIHRSETDTAEIETEELLPEQDADEEGKPKEIMKEGQPDLFSLDDGDKKEEKKSVAEVISDENPGESVADKLQKQTQVNNLKNAIGINEKFFFINELFEGNLNLYNKAIDSLDELQTYEESIRYVEELSDENQWQVHPEAVEQLEQFLKRKFNIY